MLSNLEAEQTLLGLAMTDQECAEQLALLPDDSFFYSETKALYRIIREIIKEHGIPNVVSVGTRIPGSAVEMMECSKKSLTLSISPTMYKQIESEILDLRKRRVLLSACEKVANKASDPLTDVDEMMKDLTSAINDNGEKDDSVTMQDAAVEWMEDLGKGDSSVSTGLAGIDSLTGGLQKGVLAILGARPKVGKTALALSIARNVAKNFGPVLIVSLEMTRKEILTRFMAAETGVDMQKLVTKQLNEEDQDKLPDALRKVGLMDMRIINKQTPLQIRRVASQMLRKEGLSLIVVDYIQLMKSDEHKKSRYEEVSSISRELKLMAMELDVPILALTQFNRDSEQGGKSRKPSMAEARDSGSIEQDANIFIIQYAPDEPKPDNPMREYWDKCADEGVELQILDVAANRQGPTGFIMTRFDKAHMKFSTLGRRA